MTLSLEKYHGWCFVHSENATAMPECCLKPALYRHEVHFFEAFWSSFINFLNLLILFTSLEKETRKPGLPSQ